MVSEETLYMTVAELGPQIKAKKLSPLELTRAETDEPQRSQGDAEH